ncbi:MAG: ABC transporter ATP-binding protein [Deltaproteobacteria bacterium]|nr:ABC transporter ATP-binding protein [Deltaproteobacteria bacterium]
MSPLLKTDKLTKYFGGVKALDGVDMEVRRGIIQSIIGPNGAGKTTFFNVVSGVLRPSGGEVVFDGERISESPPHRIASRGLTRTFQNLQLFSEMTVLENVMVGMHLRSKSGIFSSALKLPSAIREERAIRERSMYWLRFVGLDGGWEKIASSLPFGRQRVLEMARALASEPRLLMLDEPAAGLNNRETQDLAELIVRIKNADITILLVEHDMDLVMEVSEHVMVMDQGKLIAEGDPEAIRKDEKVLKAYLGVE